METAESQPFRRPAAFALAAARLARPPRFTFGAKAKAEQSARP
jgi:hypothetical protein